MFFIFIFFLVLVEDDGGGSILKVLRKGGKAFQMAHQPMLVKIFGLI